MGESSQPTAWLVRASGPHVGKRHLLRGPLVRIGRDPECDLQPDGDEADYVSTRHAEIRLADGVFWLTDLDSTNGTQVNGITITEEPLTPGCLVRFGASGPEYRFELVEADPTDLGATIVAPAGAGPEKVEPRESAATHAEAVAQAVDQARRAREAGFGGQTTMIMRNLVDAALHRSRRRHRIVIWSLIAALVLTLGASYWRISSLKHQQRDIDRQIADIETRLEEGGLEDAEINQLIADLNRYQQQALKLQDSMFYKLGVKGREEAFIEREIRAIMTEFGAEQYSIPPEFTQQVKHYMQRYQEQDRAVVERVLGHHRQDLEMMQGIFRQMNLPPDLVAMALVESSFLSQRRSSQGAAGLWQFTPATARAYGLQVNRQVDERFDLEKSTRAAGRYVKALILEFGAGSSVMLALAAYNVGPGKVKRAVRKVQDPIKQRNFWYLYRVRALPRETRQYVPKIIAAIIIGRNLDHFGF